MHRFTDEDLAELVVLQRCCWVQEALANETLDIPALHESHDQVLAWAQSWHTLIVRANGRLVAAVRGRAEDHRWHVGRLMVAPDLAGRGIGAALLRLCERAGSSHRPQSSFSSPVDAARATCASIRPPATDWSRPPHLRDTSPARHS